MSLKDKINDQKRIEFARQVEQMYESMSPQWRKVMLLALLRGVALSFGIFLGGTILVTILLWILSGLEQLPFLEQIINTLRDTIQKGQ